MRSSLGKRREKGAQTYLEALILEGQVGQIVPCIRSFPKHLFPENQQPTTGSSYATDILQPRRLGDPADRHRPASRHTSR